MDDIDSVTMAGTWKQDIVNNAVFTDSSGNPKEITVESNKFIPILLLGNKVDKVSLMIKTDILQTFVMVVRGKFVPPVIQRSLKFCDSAELLISSINFS